jgi:hypothetical protein
VVISDGDGGANYAVTLTVNNNGIILALNPPVPPVASPVSYIPTAGSNSQSSNADWVNPGLQPTSSVAPGFSLLVLDGGVSDALGAENVVGAVQAMSSVDSSGVAHALLGGGETYLDTYYDGSSSSTTVVDVYEHSIRLSVSNTSLALHMDFPVADASKILGRATIDAANGQMTVSLIQESGTLPERSAREEAAAKSFDVHMAGSDGSNLEFTVSLAGDLIIEPRNANALAALTSRGDEKLLKLMLGQAIIEAATEWNVRKIQSVRLLP